MMQRSSLPSPAAPDARNPVTDRIAELVGRWNRFALDSDARLLRWECTTDDGPLVAAFVEMQNGEAGEIPDLLVVLDARFTEGEPYGHVLAAALAEQYEETRSALREEGLRADWTRPARGSGPDPAHFAHVASSLREELAGSVERLGILLAPVEVEDGDAWESWLEALLPSLPEEVRILVLDDPESPLLAGLAARDARRVRTERLCLDLAGAAIEISRASGGSSPADRFRRAFLGLSRAAGSADLLTASREARAALAVARREGWPEMEVAVHLALGAGWLGAGDSAAARASYRAAVCASDRATAASHPAGRALQAQTRLAEAGAVLAHGVEGEAAPLYEEAALLASTAEDPRTEVEGWRLAAHCHERAGDLTAAWRCGREALDAGERMTPGARRASTLDLSAEGLLRAGVALRAPAAEMDRARRRLAELRGGEEPHGAGLSPTDSSDHGETVA